MTVRSEYEANKDNLPIVVPSAEMDDEIFVKHWKARHGTDGFVNAYRPGDRSIPTARAFHNRLHKINHPVNHNHRETE